MAAKMKFDTTAWDTRLKKIEKKSAKTMTHTMNKVGKIALKEAQAKQQRLAPPTNTGANSNPATFIKSITRFTVGTFKGNKSFKIGIFPGGKLKNTTFKAMFGVGLKRLGNLLTNGGKLRMPSISHLRTTAIRKAVKAKNGRRAPFGFVKSRTKSIKYKPIRWNTIFTEKKDSWVARIQKDFAERICRIK